MPAVYLMSPDSTVLFWLGVLIAVVLSVAALTRGLLWLVIVLLHRRVRQQIHRIAQQPYGRRVTR